MRILIVEDDAFTRLEMVQSLEKDGHIVDDFNNVADGLKALKEHKYDFVLSDLYMPKDSGLDFLEKTKGEPPFILYSSTEEYSGISELAVKKGALLFVTAATIPNLIQRSFDALKKSVQDNTNLANSI